MHISGIKDIHMPPTGYMWVHLVSYVMELPPSLDVLRLYHGNQQD